MCVLTCRNNTTSKWTREGQCRRRSHASCIFFWCHTSQDTAAVSARRAYESGVPPRSRALKGLKDSQPTRQRTAALHIVALLAQVSSAEDVDARLVTAADSTDRLVALCDLCAALTRGKAASRATRPDKPSRIPTEQKCPQSNSSWLASNSSADPFKQLARVNNQEYGKSSLRMQ